MKAIRIYHLSILDYFKSNNIFVFLNVLAVAILCTLIPNFSYVKATEYIGTTSASVLAAVEIIVANLAGYLIFKETMILAQWLGVVLIISAVLAFQTHKVKKI